MPVVNTNVNLSNHVLFMTVGTDQGRSKRVDRVNNVQGPEDPGGPIQN